MHMHYGLEVRNVSPHCPVPVTQAEDPGQVQLIKLPELSQLGEVQVLGGAVWAPSQL
jgi:hypothetical protein